MHHAGKAKQFLVEGVNLIQVEWEKYQRVNSGAKVVDIG